MTEERKTVGLARPDAPYSEAECEEIIAKLEALLDGELTPDKEQEVKQMVDSCEYCMEQYNLERSIRSLIKNGFRNVSVSTNLLGNIRKKIQQIRNT